MQMDGILLVGWVVLVFLAPIVTIGLNARSAGTTKAAWMVVVAVTSWLGVLAYFLLIGRSRLASPA